MRALFLILLVVGGEELARGLALYREGRFKEALAAFTAAETAAGPEAPPELIYDRALAALRCGELANAEAGADLAREKGGADFVGRTAFIRGSVAHLRSTQAEATAAEMPESGPTAFDAAIAYEGLALRSWREAALSRADWPEARRNVERALIRLEDLTRRKIEADRLRRETRKKETEKEAEFKPLPDAEKPEEEAKSEAADPGAQKVELSPAQVKALLEKLGEKEKAKLLLRRGSQTRPLSEKDW